MLRSARAAVASTQPAATSAGLAVLRAGGNAADAAVAVAAALSVTEPCSTGLGGDAFALVYTASTRSVDAVHGCGASPRGLTLAHALNDADPVAPSFLHPQSPSAVTVPGALAAWDKLNARFGRLPLAASLAPALELARDGFPVTPVTAAQWSGAVSLLQSSHGGADTFLLDGGTRAPTAGEVFSNQDLAGVLETIGNVGVRKGFYEGRVAQSVVSCLQELGGVMTVEDMALGAEAHVEPALSTTYRGKKVHQVGAPTHGAAVLLALNLVEAVTGGVDGNGLRAVKENSVADSTALLVESVRIAYADAAQAICGSGVDSRFFCKEYASARVKALGLGVGSDRLSTVGPVGSGMRGGGTVQFCVVDDEGNAVSMVQSNYCGFGTGHVPKGTGFTLHNRGLNFHLGAPSEHVNSIGPGKRPYHTIIPGLVTDETSGELFMAFGCMGA